MDFNYYMPANLIFGRGKINELPGNLEEFGKKALICTTSLKGTGIVAKVLDLLESKNIDHAIYKKVEPNPQVGIISEASQFFKKEKCDYLIGLGGGSSIDFAKAVAIKASHPEDIWEYVYLPYRKNLFPTSKTYPVIAIPTTSGTGSEVTKWAVVSNPDTYEKSFIGSQYIIPKLSIVDPELTITLSKKLTAATAIDALSHSIESYINIGSNPCSELFARESISIIERYLPEAVADGRNIEKREQIAWASTLAGIAINHVGTTLIHGMAHIIGGRFNIGHGLALAALIGPVMEFSWTGNLEKFADIAQLLGEETSFYTLREAAQASSNAVYNLLEDIDLSVTLSSLGLKEKDLDEVVELIYKYGNEGQVTVHPKIPSREDIRSLLLKAL